MALGYNTLAGIPRLLTYADAVAREAATKPVRGDSEKLKPLGRRSQKWRYITRDGDDVVIYEGSSPLMRYKPSGDVLVYDTGYWNKATQNDILMELMGLHFKTFAGKVWVRTQAGEHMLRPSPRARWVSGSGWIQPTEPHPENIFRYEDGKWTYVNPPGTMVHHINRKAMRMVRERYAAFTVYASALQKLRRDNPPTVQEVGEAFDAAPAHKDSSGNPVYLWYNTGMPPIVTDRHRFTHEHAKTLCEMMASEDLEQQLKAFLWTSVPNYGAWMPVDTCVKHAVLMHHHAEVLDLHEVTSGKQAKDLYAWACLT